MSNLDSIRARMLREALSGSKHHDPKPGYLSTIYPAFAHGPLAPPTMQAPVGIPMGTPEDDELVDELEDESKESESKKEESSGFVGRCVAAITGRSDKGDVIETDELAPEKEKAETDKARFLKTVRSLKKGHG